MLVEELAKQFALKIVHEKEAVLMQLLNERLGNNWTVDSLNGRLQCKVQLDQEIYYLDEKPLVKFVTTIFPTPEEQMKSEVSYRVLDNFKPKLVLEDKNVAKFKRGDLVKKKSGSEWQGIVCGEYSTELTLEGYAVESANHKGSVQIYPAGALELVKIEPEGGFEFNTELNVRHPTRL